MGYGPIRTQGIRVRQAEIYGALRYARNDLNFGFAEFKSLRAYILSVSPLGETDTLRDHSLGEAQIYNALSI